LSLSAKELNMPIVDLLQMQQHGSKHRYKIGLVSVATLSIAKGVIKSASEVDAPVVLVVDADSSDLELLPSIEMLARRSVNPVAILAKGVHNSEQAVQAIRLGCNGLILKHDLPASEDNKIISIATSCAIPVINKQALSETFIQIDKELEAATLQTIRQLPDTWHKINKQVEQATIDFLVNLLNTIEASGKGQLALEECETCQPVEHLIIYNTNTDATETAALAKKGRQVLDKIPGVRQTWSGYSVKADVGYQWCWLIRFANRKVIDSYREHPDHIAYADNYFRPFAADRISIDYELVGADEEK